MKDRLTRILLGPYRSGKSVALILELTNHCRKDVIAKGDALLIVPSKRYQRLVERRIAKLFRKESEPAELELYEYDAFPANDEDEIPVSGMPGRLARRGYLGLNIESFYQACSLILRRCGIVPRVIPEAVRPALVSRALSDLNSQGKLEHLLPIVDFIGTHTALLDLIDEMERAGLSPDDVLSRLQSSASQSSRHYELALVYQRYWEELDRIGYLDNRRVAFKCREVLAARDRSRPLFGMLGVDGFDRFNHLQLQVLEELSEHCGESRICFDYSEETNDEVRREYMWKDSSYEDLKRVFAASEFLFSPAADCIQPAPQTIRDRTDDAAEAGRDARAPRMEAFKSVDRFLEMEEIARKVKLALVARNVSCDEILVVVPNLREYKGAVEAAFDDAGVPYFVDESIRTITLPIVQFALSLLRAFESDFARSDIVRALSSRFFDLSSFGLSAADVLELDRASQKEKLIGGRSEWLRIAESLKLGGSIKVLLDCLTPPDSSAPLTAFVSWCEDVLSACLAADDEAHYQDPVQGWTEERALIEIQNLWASLVQEDAILYGDRGGFRCDYSGFIKKLLYAFEKANFRAAPAASNSVIISSVDLADSRRYDEVYLAGLVEGEFPRRPGGRGFVSADEVGRWQSFGVDIGNPRMHPAFEYALFRSLIDRARKTVSLSYPMWDMSGEELLPSFFLTGESLPVTMVEAPPYEQALSLPVSSRNLIAGKLWNGEFDLDSAGGDPRVCDLIRELEDSVAMVQARALGMLESPFNGYIADQVRSGALAVRLPLRFSASRLNEYGKCPFRYWVTHVLNLSPFEEASVKLEVRELGETYHLALEKFYDRLIREKVSLVCGDRAIIETYYDEAIEEALAWLEKRRGVNYSEFWDYEKKEIVFRLKKFLDREIDRACKSKVDYVPHMVEAAFGMDDSNPAASAPALKISDGVRTVEFRGKIDRIDIAGGFNGHGASARVIDYKAGSTAIPAREANEGRNLQLPIYALAVERCVMPGAKVSQGSYLSFMSGNPVGSLKFEPDKEDDRGFVDVKRIERFVLDYVDGMARGVFTVKPNAAFVCDRCDHQRVCRVSELGKGGVKVDVSH